MLFLEEAVVTELAEAETAPESPVKMAHSSADEALNNNTHTHASQRITLGCYGRSNCDKRSY